MRDRPLDDSPDGRQERKAAILEGLDNAGGDGKAFETAFIRPGTPGPGAPVSRPFFRTGKGQDPAGRIKTERRGTQETGLSRYRRRGAREVVEARGGPSGSIRAIGSGPTDRVRGEGDR